MNKIVFMIDFAGTRTVLEDFKKRTSIKVCIIPSNREKEADNWQACLSLLDLEGGHGYATEVNMPASMLPAKSIIMPRSLVLDCGVFPFDRILHFPFCSVRW